jgi:hypothetical protein
MTNTRACDICGHSYRIESPPENSKNGRSIHAVRVVDRYQLKRYVMGKDGKSNHYISAGSIDLCEKCWTEYAESRMQPNKRPKRCRGL